MEALPLLLKASLGCASLGTLLLLHGLLLFVRLQILHGILLLLVLSTFLALGFHLGGGGGPLLTSPPVPVMWDSN